MIQRNFDDITKTDIDFLIDNKIGEIKTLEYKEKLPASQDNEKKEFLADISSFANSSGGDIIYGIKAALNENGKKTGEPEKVVPLQGITSDEAKLQIEALIRDGIEPRIPVHVKSIDGYGADGKGFVILVRIPQSFASPHMVKFKNTSRFYCRNSAGKYQLDVQEIRNAFLATDSQSERIRSFLQNRLAKIMADETPVPLSSDHRLVLHVIPISSFLNHQRFQLSSNSNLTSNFLPIGAGDCNNRYNLDGFLTYDRDYENTTLNDGYCQTFFNGTIEAVCSDILMPKAGQKPKKGESGLITITDCEQNLIKAIKKCFKGYKELNIEAPVLISMTLIGCKGDYLYVGFSSSRASHPIDRDVVLLPEVKIESLDEDVPTIMKPIFDAVWNACGYPRSYNYTENGVWNIR